MLVSFSRSSRFIAFKYYYNSVFSPPFLADTAILELALRSWARREGDLTPRFPLFNYEYSWNMAEAGSMFNLRSSHKLQKSL